MVLSKDGNLTYFIKRFDRAGNKRVPVEDFAQLTGRSRGTKYDSLMEKVSGPRATDPEPQIKYALTQKGVILIFPIFACQPMIETHREFVRRLTTKDHTFASAHFHRFLI
jgi:hypothetical protein